MISIGEEAGAHRPAVLALHRQAFGGNFEAGLVARLHEEGLVVSSQVAVAGRELIGHILFGDLAVRVDGRGIAAVALAPMAVKPDRQRQGVGTQLVLAGLAAVRSKGREAVIVVGHPAYYPRFGFSALLAEKLSSPYAGAACMALELVAGALGGKKGSIAYPDAFSA